MMDAAFCLSASVNSLSLNRSIGNEEPKLPTALETRAQILDYYLVLRASLPSNDELLSPDS